MKVIVEKEPVGKNYHIRLVQGNQSFFLAFVEDKKACLWLAKMFRKALKSHDEERKNN